MQGDAPWRLRCKAEALERPPLIVTDAPLQAHREDRRPRKTGKTALRVSVEGGGCSGFSYKFDLVADDRTDDDVVIETDGATVLIDECRCIYMGGSVIDFVDDLMGQSFQIRNPNAVASCGCGTSFSL